MALRKIVEQGDECLTKVCRPVTKVDRRLHDLLDDMAETLADANGAGLAAPQVGILRRVCLVLDEEAEFSTGYDILAARLISVEMLLVYLSRRIERAARGDGTDAVPGKEHRWTDTKIAAIQLVYGIHAAGSVDNGNAEIGELAALFEKTFHVDLGNVYHAFGRLRGQQNPTAFLDEMKEKLLKKMRDMDSK